MGATQKLLRFGVFELNLDTLEVRKSGAVVKLPPQPFKLLVLLASHAGQIVTREEIETQIWGEETHVDFEHGVNKCIKQIRGVLGDNADRPLYIETLPRQGYRFLAPVVSKTIAAPGPRVVESQSGERGRLPIATGGGGMPATISGAAAPSYAAAAPQAGALSTAQLEGAIRPSSADSLHQPRPRFWRRRAVWIAAAAVIVVAAAVLYLYQHAIVIKDPDLIRRIKQAGRIKKAELTEKDTIVLADFDNKTGDSVFDGTLRQGLWAALEQSPFLNILSEQRIAQTMALMTQPQGAALTPALAREVCVRTGSAATLEGAIAMLGQEYVVGLKAVDCHTGDEIAVEQFTVDSKEKILPELGKSVSQIRRKLGESLTSVEKYDVPVEDVTTPSLEALQALTEARKTLREKGDREAIFYLKRALELDPSFAEAYVSLGVVYLNQANPSLGVQNLRKAFDLRERVSQRERYHIEAHYYGDALRDIDQATQTYTAWAKTYPGDYRPPGNLAEFYMNAGQYEAAAAEMQRSIKLAPDDAAAYAELMAVYAALNRRNESLQTFQTARARSLDTMDLRLARYRLAFLEGNKIGMQEQLSWAAGKPALERWLLEAQALTDSYYGRLQKSRRGFQQAIEAARKDDAREDAALLRIKAALVEAEVGNAARVRQIVKQAPAPTRGEDQGIVGLALARAGQTAEAEKIADELEREFPSYTMMQRYWVPRIRAAIALERNNPQQVVAFLQIGMPYEMGNTSFGNLYPFYLRGEAYLKAGQGRLAAAAFQKMLDHPGILMNFVTGALAHLQLARAQAMMGDKAAARKSYQNFLTLWKDADPDIPIYKQAQAEYAKLK